METDTEITQLKNQLKSAGLSVTKARIELFRILERASSPLSIQEIIAQTQNAHFVSVYRSVDALLKADVITRISLGFQNKFELSAQFKPHHHHVTCEECGYSMPVNSVQTEKIMNQMTRQAGFKPTHHSFELYGVCRLCIVLRKPARINTTNTK